MAMCLPGVLRLDQAIKQVVCFLSAASLLGGACGWTSGQDNTVTVTASGQSIDVQEEPIGASAREHWAFRPLRRPALPQVKNTAWVKQPLDCFVLAALEEKGIKPLPQADRHTLIRRVFLDLTGLPPTAHDIRVYSEDDRPDWFDRLVDRLLTSPDYGPHWAQFWLDLARFAETDGFEHDKIRPDAWKYRDWVVQAADRDVPYDQFVAEQIAGDLLHPGEDTRAIPTAFCLAGPDMPDLNDQQERRHVLLNEMTATVGSVFLGLQMGCAQCHDHKYDPISQADFYRLRAFFENTIKPQRDQSLFCLSSVPDVELASHVYVRGDWRRPGPKVLPDVPRVAKLVAGSADGNEGEHGNSHKYDRRALAEWMGGKRNGLTARVIANRVWQFHFGRGLCSSESDFGFAGDEPSHADLLDWLAAELVSHDWSLKHLHRLLVTSATYQTVSAPGGAGSSRTVQGWDTSVAADPENRLWGRFPRRRLAAEVIRDAMLSCAGMLNRERGGPGVRPPLEPAVQATLLKGQWDVTAPASDHYRRSIYLFARRNLRWPLFETFDRPDANQSCPRRHESTTALQALYLLNSPFTHQMARCAAEDVLSRCPSMEAAVSEAVIRTWGRQASQAEREQLLEFVRYQTTSLELSCADALADLFLALFNTNEFLYLE